ncbi:glycoside hydrolase family 6 protein [Actinoplanes sp. TFC3]|uniref:glycoside hydrolase family 6 protein n=1 Tax=Actinoplanes sp. TFC3 TaxID=1710355 RepID=UPI0035180083
MVAAVVAGGVGLVAFDRDRAGEPGSGKPAVGSPPPASAGRGSSGQGRTLPALYVDPDGAAAQQVREFRLGGRTKEAALVSRIADRPTATWFADSSAEGVSRARSLVESAGKAGKMPILTLYNIPHRDCSGQSAGGAASAAEYRSWIAAMAGSLRDHDALVVLEPDAVAQAVQGCLTQELANQRYTLVSYAVSTLSANAGTRVYLDAGNPTWITDTTKLATALQRAGIERSRGFALNVANFETTRANVEYGTALSAQLGGAPFVVDTSRNGNGPAKQGPRGHEHWCNPPGRKLGDPPTTKTGNTLVDAYLWIKRPGESDGACGKGAPAAGQWWPEYALELAR